MQNLTYGQAMEQNAVVLTLKINNSQPIPLSAFVGAFTSLADEYRKSAQSNIEFDGANAEIFVKEIKSGSIIADLLPVVAPILPLVAAEAERVWLAIEFVETWGERLSKLAQGLVPSGSSKSDLNRWANAVEAIARDPEASSTLEAATFEDGKRQVRAAFTFQSSEAQKIQNTIDVEYTRLEEKTDVDHERVLMMFTRSDIGDAQLGKRSGERVVIGDISEKPLAITYGSELAEQRVKHEIRDSDDNIYKKGFNVDVRVQYLGTRPIAYSIVNVHEVIDLPDE